MNYPDTYFISSFFWKNFNAASKARIDLEKILKRMKLKEISVFKDTITGNIRRVSLRKLTELLFLKASKYRDSNVIFQNGTGIDIFIAESLRKAFKNGKRIVFVHDVESLRYGRKIDIIREKIVFPKFTHAICCTEEMAEFLKEELGFEGKTYSYNIWDYLLEDISHLNFQEDFVLNSRKFVIAYAGNLSQWKSGFLNHIVKELTPKNYVMHLYGKGFDGEVKEDVLEIKGAYPPDELPYKLKAHFGLVWDGESIDNISGTVGEYLKYNSPHKASLYIVSGLPLIVWKQAAIYRIVKDYNIGFGIDSLKEIDEVLPNISSSQYFLWKKNTIDLAQKLAQGKNLENVLEKVLLD